MARMRLVPKKKKAIPVVIGVVVVIVFFIPVFVGLGWLAMVFTTGPAYSEDAERFAHEFPASFEPLLEAERYSFIDYRRVRTWSARYATARVRCDPPLGRRLWKDEVKAAFGPEWTSAEPEAFSFIWWPGLPDGPEPSADDLYLTHGDVTLRARQADRGETLVLHCVLHGGEDYELLFTTPTPPDELARLLKRGRPGVSVHPIGRVVAKKGVRLLDADGRVEDLRFEGYRHF